MLKFVILVVFTVLVSTFSYGKDPIQTVNSVDLERYTGKWFELARFPNPFEKNCYFAEALYEKNQNDTIKVINSCTQRATQKREVVVGEARVTDTKTNAKLKVTFLPRWLRWSGLGLGDYWIIMLGKNYEYSVVSEPKQKYLWILSRTESLDQATYEMILTELAMRGFDISKLELSRQ